MAIRRMLENKIHFRYKFCSGLVPCWILGDRKLGESSRQSFFMVRVLAKLENKPYEIHLTIRCGLIRDLKKSLQSPDGFSGKLLLFYLTFIENLRIFRL